MRTTVMCKVDKLWGNHVLLVKEIIFPFKKKKKQTTHSLIGCINLVNIFHLKDVKIFFHDLTWLPLHFSHTGPYSCWGSLVKQASLSSSQWSRYTCFSHSCTFAPCMPQIQRKKKNKHMGLEKQRSSNFLALFLSRWWSGQHVVIGATLYPGRGQYTQT